MSEIVNDFKQFILKYKSSLILGLCLVISLACLALSITHNYNANRKYQNNVDALTDTISVYKAKNGNLVAEKTILEGSISDLKKLNEDLYDEIKNLKLKKPDNIVYVETQVVNEVHDTTWMVKPLELYFKQDFDFSNQFRTLNGFIEYQNQNLKLSILNDIVNVNYTLAVKDNKVYVTSNNPYVRYNEIQGFTLQQKKPKWGIAVGPSINGGWDPINKKPTISIGGSIVFGYLITSF